MRLKIPFIGLTYLLLVLFSLQHCIASPSGATYFLQTNINSLNGLPQNTIRDMVYSKSGFLWLATEDGLVRFDGSNCRIYNNQNSSIKNNRIAQLLPTKDGHLYFLDEIYHLYEIIENNAQVTLHYIKSLPHIGFSMYHLFKPDNLEDLTSLFKITIHENTQRPDKFPFYLFKKNNLVLQRCKEGLVVYNNQLKRQDVIKIETSYDNDYFILGNTFYTLKKNGKVFKTNFTSNTLVGVSNGFSWPHHGKLIWNPKTYEAFCLAENKLFSLTEYQGVLQLTEVLNNLPKYEVTSIVYSQNKNELILGTEANGFYVYRKKLFNTLLCNDNDNCFYAQAPIYSRQSILVKNQNELKPGLSVKRDLPKDYSAITLCLDSYQRIWYAPDDTLRYFDIRKNKSNIGVVVPGALYAGIDLIYSPDAASLIIASSDRLFKYNFKNKLELITHIKFNDSNNRAYCIEKQNDSIYYLGTHEGLYKLNIKNGVLYGPMSKHLKVRALHQCNKNLILAGTYGNGYYALIHDSLIKMPLDANNNLINTHTFVQDQSGFVWMSTNNGLYKIALHDIQNYLINPSNSRLHYYRYSNLDGLLSNEFNGGCMPSVVKINKDTWSLPSMQGLVWFQPDSLKQVFSDAPLFVDQILLNGVPLQNFTTNLNTKEHNFNLKLFLACANWSDPENLYVDYQLVSDTDSTEWLPIREITAPLTLQNLKGGQHRLIIRKKTGNIMQPYNYLYLSIDVPKLIYERKWFWPITVLIALLLSLASVRLANYSIRNRKNKLQKLVQEKTIDLRNKNTLLQAQNEEINNTKQHLKKELDLKNTLLFLIGHDIATPIKFMNMYLSGALEANDAEQLSKDEVADLKISVNNLELLLNNLITWLKQHTTNASIVNIENTKLADLLADKIKLFGLTINKKQIECINKVDTDLSCATDKTILGIAIQNILANAINYTKKDKILISAEEQNNQLVIRVENPVSKYRADLLTKSINHNSPEQSEGEQIVGYGIGLKISAELLALVGASVTLEQNNTTNTATITIPKR